MQQRNISFNNFEQCIKCTICTVYCPVVSVNPAFPGPKQAGPDGERLRLKNKFFFDENLKFCMNCKRCEVACPSGVKIADLIHSARRNYDKQFPELRDVVLANTDLMGKFARPVAPLVNSLISTKPAKVVMDVMLDIDRNRAFPKYQSRGFRGWFKKEARAAQDCYRNQLAYFHGCSTEYQHPEVGKAFVQVMNAVGWGVRLLKEKCCGVAMISNGLWSQVARNANHNIAEFRKAVSRGLPIVATASTCTLTMRDEYPHILGIDNADVRDHITLVEKFLFEKLDAGEIRLVFKNDYRARIVYHIPCHMEKLGWSIFTEELIRMIPGVSLTVLDSGCCGIAGTYGFKKENYASSQAIGKSVFDQINALSPDFVCCECETCKWQIEMSTAYKVFNPIVILAEALDLEATAAANQPR
ncbi:MAG: anaerobic glycerol-3-phosphate dehydrogenase subunit C [Bacteroidales bacterium]|jgi:glycerol-3-phosphate dehydrogenase subunit C|nr:anaerobic glycerol-3-phosphate dehydrogenase subunit GlpC [Bacteroidota bacterium]NLN99010.1 anaerobic glycerol-3-phosphate dehydrogenase subunit C [Bacteroidales bacterium]